MQIFETRQLKRLDLDEMPTLCTTALTYQTTKPSHMIKKYSSVALKPLNKLISFLFSKLTVTGPSHIFHGFKNNSLFENVSLCHLVCKHVVSRRRVRGDWTDIRRNNVKHKIL